MTLTDISTSTDAALVRMSAQHPTWHLQRPGEDRTACGRPLNSTAETGPLWPRMGRPGPICTRCAGDVEALDLDATQAAATLAAEASAPGLLRAGRPLHSDDPTMDGWAMLALDEIVPAPDNPRRSVGDLTELVASIQAHGILEPLLVTPNTLAGPGRFLLVCGARRLAAARQAGLDQVPAVIRELTEPERVAAMLVENVQRASLTPLEEASAYARLLEVDPAATQRDLARLTGVSQGTISKRLGLLELPDEARDALDSGGITLGQAQELHKLVEVGRGKQAVTLAKEQTKRTKTLAGGGMVYGATLEQQVTAEVKEAKAQARAAKARQDLRAAGVPVVEEPRRGWWNSTAARLAGQDHERWCVRPDGGEITGTVEEHATGHPDGHAAAVCHQHGEAVWLCTDPRVHAATDPDAATRQDRLDRAGQEAAERRDRDRQLTKAQKLREAFLVELLAKPRSVPANARDLLAQITAVALERQEAEAAKLCCRYLGLEPVIDEPQWEGAGRYKNYRKAVTQHADVDLGRVAYALYLAEGEFRARWTHSTWHGLALDYIEHLVAKGYELAPVEQARLKEALNGPAGHDDLDGDELLYCRCGDEADDHDPFSAGACTIDGCDCPAYQPDDEDLDLAAEASAEDLDDAAAPA